MFDEAGWQEFCERRAAWAGVPGRERERLTFETIGTARSPLTVPEVARKIENDIFGEVHRCQVILPRDIRGIVERLHSADELERIPVLPGTRGEQNATRWRWARRMPSDLICDLEAAFAAPSAHLADRPDSGAMS